jgi:hypothetical protein
LPLLKPQSEKSPSGPLSLSKLVALDRIFSSVHVLLWGQGHRNLLAYRSGFSQKCTAPFRNPPHHTADGTQPCSSSIEDYTLSSAGKKKSKFFLPSRSSLSTYFNKDGIWFGLTGHFPSLWAKWRMPLHCDIGDKSYCKM